MHDPITVARFWSKVSVSKNNSVCWPWRGSTSRGYGRMKVAGKSLTASRMAWEIFHGKSMGDKWALHRCDNRTCCNPYHIYDGTREENARDAALANERPDLTPAQKGRVGRRLTGHEVLVIRKRIKAGERVVDIASELGIGYTTVHSLKNPKRWPDHWPT